MGRNLSWITELRMNFQAVDTLVQDADDALVQLRFGDARQLYNKATERGRTASAEAASQLEGILSAGDLAIKEKKYDGAAAKFEQILALRAGGPRSFAVPGEAELVRLGIILPQAYRGRAESYIGQHDYDRAITDCTEAIRLDPNLARAYCIRGEAYYGKKDYDRAVTECIEAIRLDPKLAIAYCTRGEAYHVKRDYDLAITDYTEAIRLDPNLARAYCFRGEAHGTKG